MISPVRALPPQVGLVPMKPADVEAVAEMETAIFGEAEAWPKQAFADYLHRSGIVAAVATLGGHPVGYVLAHAAGETANVDSVGVLPEARGHGVGEKLMRYALDRVGTPRCTLQVRADNAPARKLYDRLGFRVVGQLPGYYGPGLDGLQMLRG